MARSPERRSRARAVATTGPRLVASWGIGLPDGTVLGEDRIRLIGAIRDTGSLLQAAMLCGVSYRTAWTRVRELNRAFAAPLVESVQGGAVGGASRLSSAAARLLALHEEVQRLFLRAEAVAGLDPNDAGTLRGFRRRLAMRTSIRNRIPCVVREVTTDSVRCEVELDADGGGTIVALVTAASAEELELAPGREAWVLVKAGKVSVQRTARRGDRRNRLGGIVIERRSVGASDEVTVRLDGGCSVVAGAPGDADNAVGTRVHIVFDEADVVLAVE